MATVLLQSPTLVERDASCKRFSALFVPDGRNQIELYFDVPHTLSVSASAEPFITALLPIFMLNGLDLQSEAPVRPGFLAAANRVQDILRCWYPDFARINISATEKEPASLGTGTSVFFSGGVDSFYSVQKNLDRVTDFALIRGFDIADWNQHMWPPVEQSLRNAASELGKPLIPIGTNLRQVADCRKATWETKVWPEFWVRALHGSALAAVGYLLSSKCKNIIIPSSHTYANLVPHGSHPLLDESWSTPTVRVEHDGSEATRLEKIRAIKDFPVAMKYLRVCWRNWDDQYNCGRCEKCLRTMLIFRLVGASDRAPTLPALNLDLFKTLEVPAGIRYYYQDFLAIARERKDDQALEACEMVLGKRIRWRLLSQKAVGKGRRAKRILRELFRSRSGALASS